MKKLMLSALVAVGVMGGGGCQQIQTASKTTLDSFNKSAANGTQRSWEAFLNKDIRDKFMVLKESSDGISKSIELKPELAKDKFKIEKRSASRIHLFKEITHDANFGEAKRKIDSSVYISEKDLAAKYFVEQALAKGNEVRVYKASVGGRINAGLTQAITEFKGSSNRYNVDPVFIEYDKMGSPVAIMTRSWQSISTIGVTTAIYTNIYFGADGLRWFENNFGNKYLENEIIRTIKK